MDYIIIIGIIILIILSIISIMKNVNESNITERLGKLENSTIKEISDFKFEFSKIMNDNFENLNEKVNNRLTENFTKSNKELSEFKVEMINNLNTNIDKYFFCEVLSNLLLINIPIIVNKKNT